MYNVERSDPGDIGCVGHGEHRAKVRRASGGGIALLDLNVCAWRITEGHIDRAHLLCAAHVKDEAGARLETAEKGGLVPLRAPAGRGAIQHVLRLIAVLVARI